MYPAKIQISLRIRALWSEFSKDAKVFHVDNENWSDCVDIQADMSLHWAHISEGTFFHTAAHFLLCSFLYAVFVFKYSLGIT